MDGALFSLTDRDLVFFLTFLFEGAVFISCAARCSDETCPASSSSSKEPSDSVDESLAVFLSSSDVSEST